MEIRDLGPGGVRILTPARFEDERGFFAETFREEQFAEWNLPAFIQSNHSHSTKNVLRGLHYQLNPESQGKLVQCVAGRIFDVAVDLRRGSPTFGDWVGLTLGGDEGSMIYVPPGFAHGFCVLSDFADVVYRQSAYYCPELQRSIRWNDEEIGILWPVDNPLLSRKDEEAGDLISAEINFVFEES